MLSACCVCMVESKISAIANELKDLYNANSKDIPNYDKLYIACKQFTAIYELCKEKVKQ